MVRGETLAAWYVRVVGFDGRAVIEGTAEEPKLWITHADGDVYAICWHDRQWITFARGGDLAARVIENPYPWRKTAPTVAA